MKKFVYLILASVLAAVALSCSRLPVDTLPEGLIAFRQEGFPLFNASVQTKATVVDESTLNTSGFNVSCTTGSAGSESSVWNNVAFSKSDSYFVADGDGKWWPTTDPGYHFYGSNAGLTFNADGCTVAATNATDVVCAYLPSPTYKSTNTLAFQHIFARITDVTFTAIDGYTISDISVTIVPNTGGTYNLRTGNGQTDGTGWSSLIEGTATTIANSTPGTKSNDLYLVPGSYRITASWTATKGAYSQTFSNKYCDIDVVGGKCNVITANLIGDASAIEFSVSVNAWGSNTIAIGNFPTEDPPPPVYLPGEFSVSSTKKVHFAKGNLQAVIGGGPTDTYNYSASEWKFAEKQYDIIGNAPGNTSFAVGTTVDLFVWVGTSASYDSYGLCTNTSTNNAYYGSSASDALKTDWGFIPGVVSSYGSGWHTLTSGEWNYLLASGRTDAASKRALATVCSVPGLLILPDVWTLPAGCSFTVTISNYTTNVYDETAWDKMEAAGAVFLPAAGGRNGVSVDDVGSDGFYWSSSVYNVDRVYSVYFNSSYFYPQNRGTRYGGFSVRLVKEVN